MKARIIIDIDTDSTHKEPDSIEALERVIENAFTNELRWSLLNPGSSLYLARSWAEAQLEGARVAIVKDAGPCWFAEVKLGDLGYCERDTTRDDIRRILEDEDLCAEAMVAEIGEIVNREEAAE